MSSGISKTESREEQHKTVSNLILLCENQVPSLARFLKDLSAGKEPDSLAVPALTPDDWKKLGLALNDLKKYEVDDRGSPSLFDMVISYCSYAPVEIALLGVVLAIATTIPLLIEGWWYEKWDTDAYKLGPWGNWGIFCALCVLQTLFDLLNGIVSSNALVSCALRIRKAMLQTLSQGGSS